MVRTVARYHEEKHLNAERAKKEEKTKLRRIAATIAREIEYFWSNIEQVILHFWNPQTVCGGGEEILPGMFTLGELDSQVNWTPW